MRSLTIAAGVTALIAPLSAADGAVLSINGPLSHLCYQSALAQDSRASAVEGCTRALTEESLDARDRAATFVNRGILRMAGHDVAAADADFDSALALDSNIADAWLNKGFLRLRQGDGRAALPLLQEGINRNPERRALAIFARGVAHEQMGHFDAAYADLKRAQELEPRWSMPTEYLARYRAVTR